MKFSIFGDFLYSRPCKSFLAHSSKEFREAFDELERYRKQYFCVGFVSYEAYLAFESEDFYSSFPLLYFTAFKHQEPFSPQKSEDVFFPHHRKFLDKHSYIQKIQSLQNEIKEGNTYQGNFTTFLEFQSTLESKSIFKLLLQRQNTAYKAFLPTPFGEILSFSPELFFQIRGQEILTKPMKGTMPRGESQGEDEANKLFLSQDLKNRSENVMIVDLLRNDLSKIIQKGSLQVPHLFEIETYPTLFQMTSSIQGKLIDGISLFEVFEALYPCGSITGAPKKSTIEILKGLENKERGVYCGAIGMLYGENATFSIPIRTIYKQENRCLYGVGSGIVWDSKPEEEYAELQTKMKFLFSRPDFSLLETMLYTPCPIRQEFLEIPSGLAFLSLHLERLKRSAGELGFAYQESIEQDLQDLSYAEPKVLRLLLSEKGEYKIEVLPLSKIESNQVILLEKTTRSDLDQFKTTLDKDLSFLQENKLFDVIYHQEGILLEGKRSNLVLELEDGFFTPKYEHNFLPGVCRAVLLQNGVIKEKKLEVADLKRAKRVFCINSVRGILEVSYQV